MRLRRRLAQACLLLVFAPFQESSGAGLEDAARLLVSGDPLGALVLLRDLPPSDDADLARGMAAAAVARLPPGHPDRPGSPDERRALLDEAAGLVGGLVKRRPAHRLARQELARVLFDRGRCAEAPEDLWEHLLGDDCEAAAWHVRRALAADLPEGTRGALERMLAAVEARKRLRGSFGIALAPDTNVNAGASARHAPSRFRGPGGERLVFEIDESSRESSGIGIVLTGGAELRLPLASYPDTRWRAGLHGWRREYASSGHDRMHAVLRAGLERLLPRAAVSILASAERHWEAGRLVSRGFGPRGEGSFLLGTRLRLQAAIERIDRRHREAPLLDGPRSNADVVLGFAARPSLVVGARAGRSRSRARSAQASSSALRYGAFAEYELPSVRGLDGVDVRVSADRTATAWDAPGYLPFTLEPRRDRTTVLALTLGRRGLEWGGFTPSVSLVRERRTSTVPALFDYRRSRVEATLRRAF